MMFSHSTASGYEYSREHLSPAAGGLEEWSDDGMCETDRLGACHHMLIMIMVMTEL